MGVVAGDGLRIVAGLGRGRSTVSIVLVAFLTILLGAYALRQGMLASQTLWLLGFFAPIIGIVLAPLLSSVTVSNGEVKRSSWPFGTRSLRLDEIASVARTRIVHRTRTGSVENSYLTILPRDERAAPLDIRIDFYAPEDVKSLWRACGGDNLPAARAPRSQRRSASQPASGAMGMLSDKAFRQIATFGFVVLLAGTLPALFSHPPNLSLMAWTFLIWSSAGVVFELLAGRVGDRTIVRRADHPDIYWSKIVQDVALVAAIGIVCISAQSGLIRA